MNYDDDMMIELIACAELSYAEIAEKVGVSRQTVWQIATNQSRPELQRKISATADGIRQAAIRHVGKYTEALLEKQAEVALGGDGETARKAREFLLKMLLVTLPDQAAKRRKNEPEPKPEPTRPKYSVIYSSLTDKLNYHIDEQLGILGRGFPTGINDSEEYFDSSGKYIGPPTKDYPGDPAHPRCKSLRPSPYGTTVCDIPGCDHLGRQPCAPIDNPEEKKPDKEKPDKKKPAEKPDDKKPTGRKIEDPFAQYVMGPHGVKVLKKSLEIEREELEELRKNPPRPRRPRVQY
ncbi:MAG: AsnC family protein [bacterium]|nr:AsnC family protein [bacterium]